MHAPTKYLKHMHTRKIMCFFFFKEAVTKHPALYLAVLLHDSETVELGRQLSTEYTIVIAPSTQ